MRKSDAHLDLITVAAAPLRRSDIGRDAPEAELMGASGPGTFPFPSVVCDGADMATDQQPQSGSPQTDGRAGLRRFPAPSFTILTCLLFWPRPSPVGLISPSLLVY